MVVETLQKIKLKAVVLLFGCASTRINRLGPQVSTYGSYHMFLISRWYEVLKKQIIIANQIIIISVRVFSECFGQLPIYILTYLRQNF